MIIKTETEHTNMKTMADMLTNLVQICTKIKDFFKHVYYKHLYHLQHYKFNMNKYVFSLLLKLSIF